MTSSTTKDRIKVITCDEDNVYRNGISIEKEVNNFLRDCAVDGYEVKNVQSFANNKGDVLTVVIHYSMPNV